MPYRFAASQMTTLKDLSDEGHHLYSVEWYHHGSYTLLMSQSQQ
jgi:hypothetical protein